MVGLSSVARLVFGSSNERRIKGYDPKIRAINALETKMAALSDAELTAKTADFRAQLAQGTKLDSLLVEAFAVVREASKRVLKMRPFDVQMVGGMVLHEGSIAEMKTGEGKTLVATLPVYLNALAGRGVHVVTVNDYLASRDSEWMGQLYNFLGLSVGVIVHGLSDDERRKAYASDITYGTNNEFGFDYLRDNMKYERAQMVQREHFYAIVDEVDSILIDEARTPLIISGPLDDRSELYNTIDAFVPQLTADDYEIDEKQRSAVFTENGTEKIEQLLRNAGLMKGEDLYDVENTTLVHHINQALRAQKLFSRDKDYIVRNNEVVIIDEFTGRMMPGRRFSEGLHQALEAKEKVTIQPENQTLASITFQNYFRLYDKLAGMTGTAATEADEFYDIYKLEVVEVPTNLPVSRKDEDDEVYKTVDEKFRAILRDVQDAQTKGQPTLVGTTSIEKSEYLASFLKKEGFRQIDFNDAVPFKALYDAKEGDPAPKLFTILNARYHEQEAFIVAQAGLPGAVTIATNMAGRGTDIKLGGNADMRIKQELSEITDPAEYESRVQKIHDEVERLKQRAINAGGLYVLGTERHESRRIDNQLRGRSGRQGDPGRSKFFLSLQDDLMRIFGSERMENMLVRLGLKEDEAIVHPWINKALEKAQQKVEARNFDLRKNLLKYDNVMNDQRKAIFEQRKELMNESDVSETVNDMRDELIADLVKFHIPEQAYPEQWNVTGLHGEMERILGLDLPVADWAKEEGIAGEEVETRLIKTSGEAQAARAARIGPEMFRQIEKAVLLQTLDGLWREHLVTLDHLRQVVGWRGYAQRDPLNEYKSEAFELFSALLSNLRERVTEQLMRVETVPYEPSGLEGPSPDAFEMIHADPMTGENEMTQTAAQNAQRDLPRGPIRNVRLPNFDPKDESTWGKVGRNDICPCGSGKKFKQCHGKLA